MKELGNLPEVTELIDMELRFRSRLFGFRV